jgi:hypothetical protein
MFVGITGATIITGITVIMVGATATMEIIIQMVNIMEAENLVQVFQVL